MAVNSQGQPFVLIPLRPTKLVPVPIPAMPGNLTAEQRQELRRLYVEYGQLHHIYYNQCPLQADRTLARDFWNQHGPVNGRGQRPNWTSDRMLSDRLSKARADIRRLGGDPQLVVQALAQGPAPAPAAPAPAAPAVASPPPPTPAPAPSTAPAVFATPVPAAPVAPVAPAPASAAPAPAQGPIFRPISPGDMKLCPLITNARSHVTPPWPIPENLSKDNLPPGWTYTNPAIDYGYGAGFKPPMDPVYVAEWRRRQEEWHREINEDNQIYRLWNIGKYEEAKALAEEIRERRIREGRT
ncbi:hypothetical protein M432DRAFT_587661 [Thermoascus aurantiacus ATCC 26904]